MNGAGFVLSSVIALVMYPRGDLKNLKIKKNKNRKKKLGLMKNKNINHLISPVHYFFSSFDHLLFFLGKNVRNIFKLENILNRLVDLSKF